MHVIAIVGFAQLPVRIVFVYTLASNVHKRDVAALSNIVDDRLRTF